MVFFLISKHVNLKLFVVFFPNSGKKLFTQKVFIFAIFPFSNVSQLRPSGIVNTGFVFLKMNATCGGTWSHGSVQQLRTVSASCCVFLCVRNHETACVCGHVRARTRLNNCKCVPQPCCNSVGHNLIACGRTNVWIASSRRMAGSAYILKQTKPFPFRTLCCLMVM